MSIHFLTNGKVGKWSWPRGSTNRKSRMIVNTIIQSESLYLTLIYMPMWPSWIITWCVHTRPITVRICLQPIRRPDFARFIFDHEFDPIGGQTKVNPCQMAGSIKSYSNWLIQTANQNKDAEIILVMLMKNSEKRVYMYRYIARYHSMTSSSINDVTTWWCYRANRKLGLPQFIQKTLPRKPENVFKKILEFLLIDGALVTVELD